MRKVEGSGLRNESLIFSGKAIRGDGEGCLDIVRLAELCHGRRIRKMSRKALTALLNVPERQ